MSDTTHAVKVKEKGSKRFEFVTPRGGLTHLRLHAALMTQERAEQVAAEIARDNPDVVEAAKAVKLG